MSKPEGNGFQSDIGRQWRIPRAKCRWVGFDYKVRGVRGQRGSLLGRVFRRERERESGSFNDVERIVPSRLHAYR